MDEWIVYQIGNKATPNVYRFALSFGFNDEAVKETLVEGEYIDTTTTLLGHLGGEVSLIGSALTPGVARIHAKELLAWVQQTLEQMGNTGFSFDFLANGSVALWYQEYAKKLDELLPPDEVRLEKGWPSTKHIYARAAAYIQKLQDEK